MFLQLSLLRSTTTTRVRFSAGQSPHRRLRLTPLFSLGGNRWKLTDLDSEIVQEKLCSWLSNAQTLIAEAAAPLVKPGQGKKMAIEHELEDIAMKEEVFMASGLTVERRTLNGYLSFASVVSIDRFGRMGTRLIVGLFADIELGILRRYRSFGKQRTSIFE